MRKELRPTHDLITCDVCGRTILKGERAEAFLAPGGQRKAVCQLCLDAAHHEGWIRESAHMESPASLRRPEPRRGILGRFRRRREEGLPAIEGAASDGDGGFEEPAAQPTWEEQYGDPERYEPPPEQQPPPPPPQPRSQPKDP